MRWRVGRKIEVLGRWHTASLAGVAELTTGAPYFRASVVDQTTGTRLYEQGGGVLAATPFNIPLPAHTAGVGFRDDYEIPLTMSSLELTIEVIHPDHPARIVDMGWVTEFDLNDIENTLEGAGLVPGDVEQENFQPIP